MNRDSFYPAIACFPLLLMLAGCAPMHETRRALSQQTPAAQVDTALPTALKMVSQTANGGWSITIINSLP